MIKILIILLTLVFTSCQKDQIIVPKQIVTEVSIKETKKPKKKLGFFKRLKAKRLARKAKNVRK
jgi:hypothetical protein